jgi:hypothetical protein
MDSVAMPQGAPFGGLVVDASAVGAIEVVENMAAVFGISGVRNNLRVPSGHGLISYLDLTALLSPNNVDTRRNVELSADVFSADYLQ